jgi:hypothetical protein
MIIYLSLAVCLIGAVIFFVSNPPAPAPPRRATWAEVGRIMFMMGLLAFLLTFHGNSTVGFLK